MILKLIRTYAEPTEVYTHIPYRVEEDIKFFDFGKSEVTIQSHPQNRIVGDKLDKVMYSVISGDITVFIHEDESAYLLNDAGKTLQIIYRP